jgi:hypothetical protein
LILETQRYSEQAQDLTQVGLASFFMLTEAKGKDPRKWRGAKLSFDKMFSESHWECALIGGTKHWQWRQCVLHRDFHPSYEQASAHYKQLIHQLNSSRDPNQNALAVLMSYCLKGVPLAASRSIVMWAMGYYPLQLLDYVPTPEELLRQQVKGKRIVSLVTTSIEMAKANRPPFEFLVHDLIHADRFYRNDIVALGQIGFFRWIEKLHSARVFEPMLNSEIFCKEFYYTISDMNAYCVHMLKCLKANVLNYFLLREGRQPSHNLSERGRIEFETYWLSLFEDAPSELLTQVENLNSSVKVQDKLIVEFFERQI